MIYRKSIFGTRRISQQEQLLPLEGDLLAACYVIHHQENLFFTDVHKVFCGALLLRWIEDGIIRVRQKEVRATTTMFHLVAEKAGGHPLEEKLYKCIREAAGDDGILEFDELYKWAYTHFSKVLKQDDIEMTGKHWFEDRGYVARERFIVAELTAEGAEEARKVIFLKNYLTALTQEKETDVPDPDKTGHYLIYALLFHLEDKFLVALQERYPSHHQQLAELLGTDTERLKEVVDECRQIGASIWEGVYDATDN